MVLKTYIEKLARRAKEASYELATADTSLKNKALRLMAEGLVRSKKAILKANARDLARARKKGNNKAFIERLTLDGARIDSMAAGIKQVAGLKDPAGDVLKEWSRPNGLLIKKVRVPIGVIGVIYESRPNVTSDCAALCIKSGNSVILRGGSESICSNLAIGKVLQGACRKAGLPGGCVNIIETTERKAVDIMLKQIGLIDLVMPRGGEGLIREVTEKSRIPVIKHYKGVCHVYVDRYADLKMAQEISFNAKCQRPGVCNAMETLLVHERIAGEFLPGMAARLTGAGVELRGDERAMRLVKGMKKAKESDWSTEYLDMILSIRIVKDIDQAIEHIRRYGSMHSDTIVTEHEFAAEEFLKRVDSACVYVNASTRFTDGNEFGMGAEIGISTDKIHARGPMGLEELCSYKYMVYGNGQIRE